MTKTLKSGEEVKNTHYESHRAEDHLGEAFETTNTEHKWIGQDIEVSGDPLVDSGTGKPIIIRVFQFAANPEVLKRMKPTKQELFDAHAKQIQTMLWADGLIPVDSIPPTVNTSKKREMYRIFVTCQARNGLTVLEKPQTLQEITQPHG